MAGQLADRLAVSDLHEADTPEHFAFATEETSNLPARFVTFIKKNTECYRTVPPACEWSDYRI